MPNSTQLNLTEDLTIYNAIELKQKLLGALESGGDLELNLAHAGEMDTAGLQLLILLKQEAQRAGKSLRITAHSQAVCAVIKLSNLGARFGDPLVIPAQETSSVQR